MSRIRTKHIKQSTKRIFSEKKDLFVDSFDENKKKLDEIATIPSKKIRNKIAGYITFFVKEEKKKLLENEEFNSKEGGLKNASHKKKESKD